MSKIKLAMCCYWIFAWIMLSDCAFGQNKRAIEKPLLVPLPKKVPVSEENPTSAAKVALGKQLFFDPRLSGDNSMSCASCHIPEKAFADGKRFSKGNGGKRLFRNTPGLLNVAFYSVFTWDGRAKSLEEQAFGPITSPDEMNQDLGELEKELNAVAGYVQQFRRVLNTPVTRKGIAMALAAFQRTLISPNSPYDRYLQGDKSALSKRAQVGRDLFTGEAGCSRCHHGPLLSDGKFYRLGNSFRDKGREAITGKKRDRYKFRTPSLRDISRTGPYMHDGAIETLEEVVMFYLRLVPNRTPEKMPLDVEPIQSVTLDDLDAIVEFLKSLSGEPPKITPPVHSSILYNSNNRHIR
jgi:cytochrome c peroxidase